VGHSSLRHLKQFPLDALKIDRAFIEKLGQDPTDTAIVQAVITVAKSLRLVVTAEGVETASQLAHLRDLGCNGGQGFYFGQPVPSYAFSALLGADPRW
jgi:EAL domain-containing protein (putative c-di-GMP-specific phosphodiesterase class I)